MKEKSPAFQFYPKDYLSESRVEVLPMSAQGAYVRLLSFMWIDADCSIPDDNEAIHSIGGFARIEREINSAIMEFMDLMPRDIRDGNHPLDETNWLNIGSQMVRNKTERMLHLVHDLFVPHPKKKGFLTSKRLMKERQKQKEWSEKSKKAGEKSGQTRIKKALNNSNQTRTKAEPNTNSSSSSSSSSSIQKEKDKDLVHSGKKRAGSGPRFLDKFLEVWTKYPATAKIGKKQAHRHYLATVKNQETHEQILAALSRYKAFVERENKNRNGNGRPWKNGDTWFNNWHEWLEIELPASDEEKSLSREEKQLEIDRLLEEDQRKYDQRQAREKAQ